MDHIITLLACFAGGRGPNECELVRFGLGAFLWGSLFLVAWLRRNSLEGARERLLLVGFGLALVHEVFMFAITSLRLVGILGRESLHPFFSPLQHLLTLVSTVFLAGAFLLYMLRAPTLVRRYLWAGGASAAAWFLWTAPWWFGRVTARPGSLFGRTAYDWVHHGLALLLLAVAMSLIARRGAWLRGAILTALGLLLLDEALILFNQAYYGQIHSRTLSPIGNFLHLAAIPVFGFVYLREMSQERRDALRGLQAALSASVAERGQKEAIAEAIGAPITIQDTDFKIIFQNDRHREIKGDHLGERCYRAYEGKESICEECALKRTFQDGLIHRTERRISLGGKVRVMEIISSPLRDASGRIVAGVEMGRDVTDRRLSEEALRQAKEALERQNEELRKLDRIKDGIIRDVTHELKTPVAKQAMQLEILRQVLSGRGALGDKEEKALGVLEASVKRQDKIIGEILDLSRLEAGGRKFRREPLRLDDLVRGVLDEYKYALDTHGFTVEARLEPLTIISDRQMLHCVVSNLVDNAVKYRRTEGRSELTVSAGPREGRVVLRVADKGQGLSPVELERVFERFYQASASAEGMGVGLNIARMIVEGVGGTIRLESPGLGLGATATVELPYERA